LTAINAAIGPDADISNDMFRADLAMGPRLDTRDKDVSWIW